MKTYELKTTPASILDRFPALCKRLGAADAAGARVCLGADLEKAGACLVAQIGLGAPLALGTLPREHVVALAAALGAQGRAVAVGLEACGFGWRFQGELRAAGATVLTLAPEPLTGRRKTNRRDAAALARVVAERCVHGNTQAGRVVREPSAPEQQRRYYTRHRSHLVALRGKMEGHGRGLLLDFGRVDYPDCWWGKKMWPVLVRQLEKSGETWLVAELTLQREQLYRLHQEVLALDRRLELLAAELLPAELPAGLGELTALTLFVEVMDWQRFRNRKQAGSYIGCCPSEHSPSAKLRALSLSKRHGPGPDARRHRPPGQPAAAQRADRGRVAAHPLGAALARLCEMGRPAARQGGRGSAAQEGRHRLRAAALHRPLAALQRADDPCRPRPARQPPQGSRGARRSHRSQRTHRSHRRMKARPIPARHQPANNSQLTTPN